MWSRHSLMQSATQNFVPRRYFFVRYRVGTSGTEIYRIFVPWPKVPATPVEPSCGTELCGTSTVAARSSVVQQRARRADQGKVRRRSCAPATCRKFPRPSRRGKRTGYPSHTAILPSVSCRYLRIPQIFGDHRNSVRDYSYAPSLTTTSRQCP